MQINRVETMDSVFRKVKFKLLGWIIEQQRMSTLFNISMDY